MKLKHSFLLVFTYMFLLFGNTAKTETTGLASLSTFCDVLLSTSQKLVNLLSARRIRASKELDRWATNDSRILIYGRYQDGDDFNHTLALISSMGKDGTDLAKKAVTLVFNRPIVLADKYSFMDGHLDIPQVQESSAYILAHWIMLELDPAVQNSIFRHLMIPALDSNPKVRKRAFQILAKLGPKAGKIFLDHLQSLESPALRRQIEEEARLASQEAIRLSWMEVVRRQSTTVSSPAYHNPITGLSDGQIQINFPIHETRTLEPFLPSHSAP